MKQKNLLFGILVAFLFGLIANSKAYGQALNNFIGSADYNTVGTVIKPLGDTYHSSYIGGYIYSNTSDPANGVDMVLLKEHTNGTSGGGGIDWQIRWGNPYGNDYIQDMIIAQNGDIIVVTAEYSPEYLGDIRNIRNAGIYRFNSSGTLLYQNRISAKDVANKDFFYSAVCELDNGNIVVVGTYDNKWGVAVTFTNALGWIFHDLFENDYGNRFIGITAYGNDVYICGSFNVSIDYSEALITYYVPPTSHVQGVFSWVNTYDIADQVNTNLINSKFTQIFPDGSGLLLHVNGQVSDNLYYSKQFVFESDLNGNSDYVHIISTPYNFCNTAKMLPISYNVNGSFDMYISQIPDNTYNDPILAGDGPVLNGFICKFLEYPSTFGTTINYSKARLLPSPGTHSILDISKAFDVTYTVGSTRLDNGNYADHDIYYMEYSTSSAPEFCHSTDRSLMFDSKQYDISHPLYGQDKLQLDDLPTLSKSPAYLGMKTICNDIQTSPSPCGTVVLSGTVDQTCPSCCGFSYTVTATPSTGYSVHSYYWTEGSATPYFHTSTSTTDAWAFTIPLGSSAVVTVGVNFIGTSDCYISATSGVGCQDNSGTGDGTIFYLTTSPKNNQYSNSEISYRGNLTAASLNNNSTSLNQITENKDGLIKIYPNPTQGDFTISMTGSSINNITILNVLGQKLVEYPYDDKSEVHLSLNKFTDGIYFIKINNSYISVINKTK